jgi:inward rectifier potassium channel
MQSNTQHAQQHTQQHGQTAAHTGAKPGRTSRMRRQADGRTLHMQAGGTIVTHGMPDSGLLDIYHRALTARWPTFFCSLAAFFLLLNAAFAGLYLCGTAPIANQSPPGFLGAFFFSVETLATVGYGDMHPQTTYAHVIATLEIFMGMSSIALATGLIFVRFSRPRARIIFSRYAVVRPLNGQPTLMVRAANARQNVIVEADAKLRVMRRETTPEGETFWHITDLRLVRDRHPIFLLGWNLMHIIDETSALYGQTAESLAACNASLMMYFKGADEATTQLMEARHTWSHDEIRWQHRFVDLISDDENGMRHIDYTHFHDVVALETEPQAPITQARRDASPA